MTRYLVTGAQGFTGRYVCAEILRTQPQATVVGTGRSAQTFAAFTHEVTWKNGHVAAPLPAKLRFGDHDRYRYARCDLNDRSELDRLVARTAPDVVIHLAAALRDDPNEVLIRSNVEGTAALARAVARLERKPLVIVGSSGSVYGLPLSLPIAEEQRCAPDEPYAMSKLAAELTARVLLRGTDVPLIVARIFNIVGPGQEERHVCGRFAAQAAAIARGDAPPTLTIGDLRPTRDFIDVRDVAHALVILSQHGVPGEAYNVASGTESAIGDVLTLTLRAAGLEGKVSIAEQYSRAADVARAFADIGKLRACGFEPEFSLDRMIADLLTYYLSDVAQAATSSATTSATS
jgi:GDP-4-dehydro-6-deoxy-D-mannose reductase